MITTRKRARSTVLGALLSGVLAFLVAAFGFASAALFAIGVLMIALLADRAGVGSS